MSSSHGKVETKLLHEHIQVQVKRLLMQLSDIDTMRDQLTQEEYDFTKQVSVNQLKEFNEMLQSGEMTLISDAEQMQLTIQDAIRDAFSTPQIIEKFTQQQPVQLRIRLQQLSRDFQIQKISSETFNRDAVQVILALQKLGETLTEEEAAILFQNKEKAFQATSTSKTLKKTAQKRILKDAKVFIQGSN